MDLTHFRPKRELLACLALVLLGHTFPGASADTDPVTLLRDALTSADAAGRAAAASRVAAHPGFRPSRLSGWLHQAFPYPEATPGPSVFEVDLGEGGTRRVFVMLPEGYRPDRAWPLVYALHPSGVDGQTWAAQVSRMLGRRAQEFIIAAPNGYRQNYIAAEPPFVPEHPAILDALARRFHVNANRVYAFGYSKGGFGTWYVALYYADRFAGAIAFASGFDVAIDEGGFWKELVRNVAHVPVYHAWGQRDPLIIRTLDNQPAGTFAEQNRSFARGVFGLGLPITTVEVPGGVHNELAPPVEPMVAILGSRRLTAPRRVSHTFRHLHQASAYWLEGRTWVGDAWGDRVTPPPPAPGETAERALTRTLTPLLGRLEGTIDGQVVRVTRQHIGEVVVWFSDTMIDWDQPVRIDADGRTVFEGRLVRDATVAISRAASTMDFENLRWAGVRIAADGTAAVLTGGTAGRDRP